jgi:hypothetical protein
VQQDGGLLHGETALRMPTYLGPGWPLPNAFDPETLDLGQYQARELSYLFDWLDARFVFFSFEHGVIHFFSLVHVVALLAAGLVHWISARRRLRALDAATLGLLTALWLSSPMVLNSGHVFRSSKALTALGVILMAWLLVRMLAAESRPSGRAIALLVLVGVGSAWADRQGYALVCVCAAFCVGDALAFRRGASWVPALALLGVAGLGYVYNHIWGPAIIEALNGYRPRFDFQHVNIKAVLTRPAFERGLGLFLDHVRWQFGSVPRAVAAAWLVAGWLVLVSPWFRRPRPAARTVWLPVAAYTGGVLFFVALDTVMAVKHPPLVWPDVRRYYYWLPVGTALLFASTAVVACALNARTRRWVHVGLLMLLAGNIGAVPGHWAVMVDGHLRNEIAQLPALKRCLTAPDPGASPELPVPQNWVCSLFRERAAAHAMGSGVPEQRREP